MKGKEFDLGLAIMSATLKGPQTQHTIACYCGVSPQRIQQIIWKALRKCRAELYRRKELSEELEAVFKR